MLIASSGVLHFFKAPDTNSIHLTHRPDRADQNCPAFFIPCITKYCNKYCNAKSFLFSLIFCKSENLAYPSQKWEHEEIKDG